MHDQAHDYLARRVAQLTPTSVVELGARETWGPKIRDLFNGVAYIGVDPLAGAGVDVVANGVSWQPDEPVDLVVCCEVFEHTPRWRDIVANAYAMLVEGGAAIFTCAGPGRPEHGVHIDDPDRPGWYANVTDEELAAAMLAAGFVRVSAESGPSYDGTDTYAIGWRS